jgi:hypothetical protein
MGSLITFACHGTVYSPPDWLKLKWADRVNFAGPEMFCIAPAKDWRYFEADLFAALQQSNQASSIIITYLYECGNVDRSFISQTGIIHSEPTGWKNIQHLRLHTPWDECVPMMKSLEIVAEDDDLSHCPYPQR